MHKEEKTLDEGYAEEVFQIMKNIIVSFDSAWTEDHIAMHLEKVNSWLERWYLWFLKISGVLDNNNMWRLYHRSITVLDIPSFSAMPSILKLSKSARHFGYAFGYEILLDSCFDKMNDFKYFINNAFLTSLILKLNIENRGTLSTINLSDIETIIRIATDKDILLLLNGSPLSWQYAKILELLPLNAKTFTIIPSVPIKHVDSSSDSIKQSEKYSNVGVNTAPCSRRMNIVITPSGSIYPCAGLVGCSTWVLGQIEQPIEKMRIWDSDTIASLVNLYKFGPNDCVDNYEMRQNGLPAACNNHRKAIGFTL